MHSLKHGLILDSKYRRWHQNGCGARPAGIVDEAFFAQKVPRPHHFEYRLLALRRYHSTLNLTGLDEVDNVRRLSLRKEFRALSAFQQILSLDNFPKQAFDSAIGLVVFERYDLLCTFHNK